MDLQHHLSPKLKQLRLSGVLATLEARHRQALDGQWSYVEFLERLLEDETGDANEVGSNEELTIHTEVVDGRSTLVVPNLEVLQAQIQKPVSRCLNS
jgi:hypothetical protein